MASSLSFSTPLIRWDDNIYERNNKTKNKHKWDNKTFDTDNSADDADYAAKTSWDVVTLRHLIIFALSSCVFSFSTNNMSTCSIVR